MQDNDTNQDEDLGTIDETAAADTLSPGAGSGGSDSKAVVLSTFTQLLAQLGKEDLSDLFNQVQAQYGPNADNGGVGDASASNKASVKSAGAMPADPMPTLGVKEDVEEMFANDELSEDFMERAEVVFEAALNTRLTLEKSKLEEAFDAQLETIKEEHEAALTEQVEAVFEEVSNKLNDYLDYSIENWMAENKLAVETSLRAEIAENFIEGLHTLFTEHYITVPESKLDIVAEMKSEINALSNKLNESMDENIRLVSLVNESAKGDIVSEVAEGLTAIQADKLHSLSEGIEFGSADIYRKKVGIIKENYFGNKKTTTTGIITEEVDESTKLDEAAPSNGTEMDGYMKAIKKIAKK